MPLDRINKGIVRNVSGAFDVNFGEFLTDSKGVLNDQNKPFTLRQLDAYKHALLNSNKVSFA